MSHELAPNQKATRFWPTVGAVVREFRGERLAVLFAVGITIAGTVLTIVAPYVLGRATDTLFAGFIQSQMKPGQTQDQIIENLRQAGETSQASMLEAMHLVPGAGIDFATIGRLLLFVIALHLVAESLMFAGGWIFNSAAQRVLFRLRERVEVKIHRVPLKYVDSKKRGDLLSRLNNDLDNVSMVLNQNLQQLITSLVTVIGVLVVMVWMSWQLALVALSTIPLTAIVIGLLGARSQKQFTEQWRSTGDLNALIEESITGQEILEIHNATDTALAQFDAKNAQVYSASLKAQSLSGSMMPAMQFVSNVVFVLIAIVGALRVLGGNMTVGAVQAFIQYSRQFSQPLAQLGGLASQLQSAAASAERVYDLLGQPEEPDTPHTPFAVTEGSVEFSHVEFSYSPDTDLLTDFNLRVEGGQTVAIVGKTGSGKTTLVNLLMRFYDVTSGAILIDGTDIRSISRADLRRPIGMVLQDTWLFGGTIYDNIAYGREDATRDEVLAAARAAYVDRFVQQLPDGYDTVITETGENVSAGQRQLITIARAFVSDPDILILDEATSSVDTRTEVVVQVAMNRLRAGRTSFVIAHRLSTIRDADVIVVMDRGQIIQQGTHEELLAQGGAYADLYAASATE